MGKVWNLRLHYETNRMWKAMMAIKICLIFAPAPRLTATISTLLAAAASSPLCATVEVVVLVVLLLPSLRWGMRPLGVVPPRGTVGTVVLVGLLLPHALSDVYIPFPSSDGGDVSTSPASHSHSLMGVQTRSVIELGGTDWYSWFVHFV